MILKTVEESNFVPNNSARNLKQTDSKSIAILVKEIDNPFFATMMRVMEKKIRRQKYSFFIQHMGKDQDEVDTALELIKEKKSSEGLFSWVGISGRTKSGLQR